MQVYVAKDLVEYAVAAVEATIFCERQPLRTGDSEEHGDSDHVDRSHESPVNFVREHLLAYLPPEALPEDEEDMQDFAMQLVRNELETNRLVGFLCHGITLSNQPPSMQLALCPDDSENEDQETAEDGTCELCGREMALTRHHLR